MIIIKIYISEEMKMANIRKAESDRRSEIVTVKCTKDEKLQIDSAAQKNNKTTSSYVLECGLAGKERRRSKDRKRATELVLQQERINGLYRQVHKDTDKKLKSAIEQIIRGELSLWAF